MSNRPFPERRVFDISVDLKFQIQFCREQEVIPLTKGRPEVEILDVNLLHGSVGELLLYLDTELIGRQKTTTNEVLEDIIVDRILSEIN